MLLRRCAVVFCTLTVAGRLSVSQQQFPTLLVDEACQAAEAEMLPALRSTAQRLFLVGDPRQLPATITSPHAKKADYGRSMPFGHRKRLGNGERDRGSSGWRSSGARSACWWSSTEWRRRF